MRTSSTHEEGDWFLEGRSLLCRSLISPSFDTICPSRDSDRCHTELLRITLTVPNAPDSITLQLHNLIRLFNSIIKLENFSNFAVVSKYQYIIEQWGIEMFELIVTVLALVVTTYFAIVRPLGGAFVGGA